MLWLFSNVFCSRPEDFDAAKNIPIFKALLDGHIFSGPIVQNPRDKEQLDIDEYELFSRQCDHDIRSFTAWQQKLSSARGAIKFRKQDSRCLPRGILSTSSHYERRLLLSACLWLLLTGVSLCLPGTMVQPDTRRLDMSGLLLSVSLSCNVALVCVTKFARCFSVGAQAPAVRAMQAGGRHVLARVRQADLHIGCAEGDQRAHRLQAELHHCPDWRA